MSSTQELQSDNQIDKAIDLKCDSCLESYNREEKLPKLLPLCFHPICSKCIDRIICAQGMFTCPFCQKCYQNGYKETDDFPTNTYILNTMYAPQKKRKLNDGTAKPSIHVIQPMVKNEEITHQDELPHQTLKLEELREFQPMIKQEQDEIVESEEHQQKQQQQDPQVLQYLRNKVIRFQDDHSHGTSNNSSRSFMMNSGSKYIYRTKEALQSYNVKRKLSQLNDSSNPPQQNKSSAHSKHNSEDSNSKSTPKTILKNSGRFQSKESSNGICQHSRGMHTFEQTDNDNNNQKQSDQPSLLAVPVQSFPIKVRKESNIRPKIQLTPQQLQQKLVPYFNNDVNNYFLHSSSENSSEAWFGKIEEDEQCPIHNLAIKYFCENHDKGFCFECHEHSFCEKVTLLEHLRIEKQLQIKQTIRNEKNAVDQLYNLLNHYQDIDKEVYRYETSQIANIEKSFSELISSLLKKKDKMIKDLSKQSNLLHSNLSSKLDCIKESIEKCESINKQTNQLQQNAKTNPFTIITNLLNLNKNAENSSSQSKNSSLLEISKRIEGQQTLLIYTLQQFQEQYNSIKGNQSSANKNSYQATPFASQSTIQSSNEVVYNNKHPNKSKCITSVADFSNYIDIQLCDRYEGKDNYLKKLPIFKLGPDILLQQQFTRTSLIKSF